jgi:hypothetical protein
MRLWEMRRRMEVWTADGEEIMGEVGFVATSWEIMSA